MTINEPTPKDGRGKHFFVFGARGTQGRPVSEALRASGALVSTLTRTRESAEALANEGVNAVIAALADTTAVAKLLKMVSGAFWHVPTTGGEEHILAALHNSSTLPAVLSTSGIVPAIGDGPFAAVTRLEKTVRDERLPVCILRPTMFLEDIIDTCPLSEMRSTGVLRYPLPIDVPICWITASALGHHAAKRLLAGETEPGRFAVLGRPYTVQEISRKLSATLHREVRAHYWSLHEYAASLARRVGRSAADSTAAVYACISRNIDQLQGSVATELEHDLGDCVQPWLNTLA